MADEHTFTYKIKQLRRNEDRRFELPNLKSDNLLLHSIEFIGDQKFIELKLCGMGVNIISYGEAMLNHQTLFDLSNRISQIIDAERLSFNIRNTGNSGNNQLIDCTLLFKYTKINDGEIIGNQTFSNFSADGLESIIGYINSSGKYVNKCVLTSNKPISSISLVPKCTSDIDWNPSIDILADKNNKVIIDFNSYEFDLLQRLPFYTLSLPDNIEKLYLVIYGYIQ